MPVGNITTATTTSQVPVVATTSQPHNLTTATTVTQVPVVTTLPTITTTTRALLTCSASLSNLNWHYPCGLNTVCFTDLSITSGVRCECASGYVGNSSAGCTKLNVLINATRVIQGSLGVPVVWQADLNDSRSATYKSAVLELVSMLDKLMSSMVGYVHNSASPKKFRYAVCDYNVSD